MAATMPAQLPEPAPETISDERFIELMAGHIEDLSVSMCRTYRWAPEDTEDLAQTLRLKAIKLPQSRRRHYFYCRAALNNEARDFLRKWRKGNNSTSINDLLPADLEAHVSVDPVEPPAPENKLPPQLDILTALELKIVVRRLGLDGKKARSNAHTGRCLKRSTVEIDAI